MSFRLLLVCLLAVVLFVNSCEESGGATGDDGDPADRVTPIGNKPSALPDFSSINLYSGNSPLNTPIDANAQVDPNSAQFVQKLISGVGSAQGMVMQLGQYSATVFVADANTPRVNVALPCGTFWEIGVSELTDVPIPTYAEPAYDEDGLDEPIKKGICSEDSSQDNHMIIIDTVKGCEYDFWQTRIEDGNWVASWGNAIELDDDGIYDFGLSTRGSGFAFLGGLIWPDELQNEEITHALVFSYPFTKSGGPVAPATDSDGTIGDAFSLPEGALVRLNPSLDLDALNLTSAEKTIARALQVYGMYLVDNGGDEGVAIYGIDPSSVATNPYSGVLPDEDYPIFANIPLDQLQVIQLTAQDANYQQSLMLTMNKCTTFN